jgi:hypothetical protein
MGFFISYFLRGSLLFEVEATFVVVAANFAS